jgi:hypothetical protein
VRCGGIVIALLAVGLFSHPVFAQYQPPSDAMLIKADRAATWQQERSGVIELIGPVSITLDRAQLNADNAVIWLTPSTTSGSDEQNATIALLGNASLKQSEVTRTGSRLLVNAQVRKNIRITANERIPQDDTNSVLFQDASELRDANLTPPLATTTTLPLPQTTPATTQASTAPAPGSTNYPPVRSAPTLFHGTFHGITSSDGKLAVVFPSGVSLSRQERSGRVLEMQASRAVLFTTLNRLRDVQSLPPISAIEEAITAAYLEGDVRISQSGAQVNQPEQRMTANRVYYEFATDRAYLTNAVIRTMDPKATIPIVVRAQTVRQLSENEFKVDHAELTTSSFAVPSYSVRAEKAYVREVDTGDPRYGSLTQFEGDNVTLRMFNFPFFYWPVMGGEFTQRGTALRGIQIEDNRRFGFGVRTEWGVMEALGYLPPPDLDIGLRADYFAERGPAAGLNIDYGGGFVTDTTKKAFNFQGEFNSYFVPNDQGIDDLGRRRRDIAPEETFRGRIRWQHQQFLPNDWQVQLTSGWVSDPNFLEQWFENEFNNGDPLQTSFYAKKQKDSEALTLLASFQPNHIVTSADLYQDVRTFGPRIPGFPQTTNDHPFEIERLPEIGYHRIGESMFDDKLTLISNNTLSGNRFMTGQANLAELGFRSPNARRGVEAVLPGYPALGTTGTTGEIVYRGDFREEVDFPFSIQQLRVMPYVQGRYTGYTDSPDLGQLNRFYSAAGVRVNTSFWKLNNDVNSDFFDIHRVRHVIEPELHLFTAAQTQDRQDVYIYDQDVDAINDVSAASVGLRQRWQTKRGGPGNERSVDFFTLNVEATWYTNKPPESVIPPSDFRGLFFPTLPEASIPRDSVNGEAIWRISDTSVLLADAQWNMEKSNLATAAVGFAARRGDRVGYFVGTRYIEELNSAITTVAVQYQISSKYSVMLRESFDFGERHDVLQSISLTRKFDRFFVVLSIYRDEVEDESGFSFALYPEGLGAGFSSTGFQDIFGRGR